MRISQLFGRTLREAPAEVHSPGLQLAVRAGLLRPLEGGGYVWLPLGARVLRRIEELLREAIEAAGGQEVRLPPALWEEEGARDRAMTGWVRREVRSYRDLPSFLYAFGSRETQAPQGPWRLREVRLLEVVGLYPQGDGPGHGRERLLELLRGLFARCGLNPVEIGAGDGDGMPGFLLPHPAGDGKLVRCPACGYAAAADAARFRLPPRPSEPLADVRPVATPDCPTIADVASFVGVPTDRTLKAVFYSWERGDQGGATLVFVVIRGDLEVSEPKLLRLLGGGRLRAATDAEIRAAGAEPGYASPVGLRVRVGLEGDGVLVVGDLSIEAGLNFVAGANREGYHLTGVNYPRDFAVTLLADVARAQAGYPCPHCGEPLAAGPAVELCRCRRPGGASGPAYLDAEGKEREATMETWAVDLFRLLAAVVETHRDEYGILWPPVLAPFDVHLVLLRQQEVQQAAGEACDRLQRAGLSVLYDDRNESAGVKFTDADLIGCPVRVTLSRRSVEAGGAEVKPRWEKERLTVSLKELPERVSSLLDRWPGL